MALLLFASSWFCFVFVFFGKTGSYYFVIVQHSRCLCHDNFAVEISSFSSVSVSSQVLSCCSLHYHAQHHLCWVLPDHSRLPVYSPYSTPGQDSCLHRPRRKTHAEQTVDKEHSFWFLPVSNMPVNAFSLLLYFNYWPQTLHTLMSFRKIQLESHHHLGILLFFMFVCREWLQIVWYAWGLLLKSTG